MSQPQRKKHCTATVAEAPAPAPKGQQLQRRPWSGRLLWPMWEYNILLRLPRKVQRALRERHSRFQRAIPRGKSMFERETGIDPATLSPGIAADLAWLDKQVANGLLGHCLYTEALAEILGLVEYYVVQRAIPQERQRFTDLRNTIATRCSQIHLTVTLRISQANPKDCVVCGKQRGETRVVRRGKYYLACTQCTIKHRTAWREYGIDYCYSP